MNFKQAVQVIQCFTKHKRKSLQKIKDESLVDVQLCLRYPCYFLSNKHKSSSKSRFFTCKNRFESIHKSVEMTDIVFLYFLMSS